MIARLEKLFFLLLALYSFSMGVPQYDRTTGEVSIKRWKLLKCAAKSFWQTVAFSLTERGT